MPAPRPVEPPVMMAILWIRRPVREGKGGDIGSWGKGGGVGDDVVD